MSTIVTKDGTEIYYKDWGAGLPLFFHHAFPLSSDEWDPQLQFFLQAGYRVIAHDRRGHGRSTQTNAGNDMDTYARDVAELTERLDLRNAVHVGHSTGGGEAARYVARHGGNRVLKLVLISSVVPMVVRSNGTPDGVPKELLDQVRKGVVANRAQLYKELSGAFYGFNRPGASVSQAVRDNWWRQGMMGGIKAQYECIKAFSETDFTEDLKQIDIPTLILQGDADQCVPYVHATAAARLLKNSRLRIYPGLPHGMPVTNAEEINADLKSFIED